MELQLRGWLQPQLATAVKGKKDRRQTQMIALTAFPLGLAHPEGSCVAPKLSSLMLERVFFSFVNLYQPLSLCPQRLLLRPVEILLTILLSWRCRKAEQLTDHQPLCLYLWSLSRHGSAFSKATKTPMFIGWGWGGGGDELLYSIPAVQAT